MTLARLLATSLVICSVPAFAQDPRTGRIPGNALSGFCWVLPAKATTASEPWRIIPDRPADLGSGQYPLYQFSLDQHRLGCFGLCRPIEGKKGQGLLDRFGVDCIHYFVWDGHRASTVEHSVLPLAGDNTCLSIRSYVVARDSRDSDSTHPVSYSTCQPSNRYQVRSADIRVNSRDH